MENRARDLQNVRLLRKLGWRVGIIWQCEVANSSHLERRLRDILDR